MKKKTLGSLGLILVAFLWGAGFPAIQFANESISPLYQIGFRFLIAGIVMSILFFKKLKYIDLILIKTAVGMSIPLFLVYLLSVIGIRNTTASRASFYCCLAVILVPFVSRILLKTKISKKSMLYTGICTLGIFFTAFSSSGKFGVNFGDILCISCSIAVAFQIVLNEKYLLGKDATLLTILEMYIVAIIGFIVAFFFEAFPTSISPKSFYSLIFMGILCTGFAYWVQTSCQKFISSVEVAIIFSLEPIFGVVISWLVLGEYLTSKGIIGGILIILALIMSQFDIHTLSLFKQQIDLKKMNKSKN